MLACQRAQRIDHLTISAIRYFDSVPHIVRYGMRDEEKLKSWMLFWRNAVGFSISTSYTDIIDTPFATKWLKLIKGSESLAPQQHHGRWEELCDCIIPQCMPLLQELAPTSRQWYVLEDYLRTPTYELQMVAHEGNDDAVAKVVGVPVEKPSYEHHLIPFSGFEEVPEQLHQHRGEGLVVLDKEKSWRHAPYKVRTPAGEVMYFMACHRPATSMPQVRSQIAPSTSSTPIFDYSKRPTVGLGLGLPSDIHAPLVQGIVISNASPEAGHSGEDDESSASTSQTDEKQPHIAGILLTYLSKAKTLADVKKLLSVQTGEAEFSNLRQMWTDQIRSVVHSLHGCGIAIGGRKDSSTWYYINHFTVYIAPVDGSGDHGPADPATLEAAEAWLVLGAPFTIEP